MTAKPLRAPSMRNPNFFGWVVNGRPSCSALDVCMGRTYSPLGDNVSCVVLVDYMGNERRILEAARMSTGKTVGKCDADGIPTQPEDQRLLPRLLKDRHTSPFEVAQFSFIVQCPIIVARQWMRHRTESYNEASGRYTILDVEFYAPDGSEIRFETAAGGWDHGKAEQAADLLAAAYANQESTYDALVGLGVHREQARMVLGTGLYTRMLVTVDLHNLMHFLALRMAPDAQHEIRQFAKVLWAMVAQMSPMCAASIVDRIRSIHPKTFEGWPTPMSPRTAKIHADGMLCGCYVAPPYRDPALDQQGAP